MSVEDRNRAIYAAFVEAWANRDIARLLSCLTDDVVYGASVGDEPGCTYRGKAAAGEGFRTIMAYDRGGVMTIGRTTFVGDLAYVEWTSRGPNGDVRGIDVLEFRGGLIAVKDAYRKSRS